MYGKIFEQIFSSSIAHSYKTRHVFMDLIVLADSEGVVDWTIEAIAGRTRVPEEQIREAISILEKPDPQSRSKVHDGARITRLDDHRSWGWQIVNYEKYRDMRTEVDRKEYMRKYMRDRRVTEKLTTVNSVNTSQYVSVSSSVSQDRGVGKGVNTPDAVMIFAKKFWSDYPTTKRKLSAQQKKDLSSLAVLMGDGVTTDEIVFAREALKGHSHKNGWVANFSKMLEKWSDIQAEIGSKSAASKLLHKISDTKAQLGILAAEHYASLTSAERFKARQVDQDRSTHGKQPIYGHYPGMMEEETELEYGRRMA